MATIVNLKYGYTSEHTAATEIINDPNTITTIKILASGCPEDAVM